MSACAESKLQSEVCLHRPCFKVCSIRNRILVLYRAVILPDILYVSETWSLTLREECRLDVFENRVLRRIFRPKMVR
jgi:hypothetical protein